MFWKRRCRGVGGRACWGGDHAALAGLDSRGEEGWLPFAHDFYVFGFFFLPQVENEI